MRPRTEKKACDQEHKPLFKLDLPEVKPIGWKTGIAITGAVAVIGLGIGVSIGTQIFFGAATLLGLVMLIESNKYIKYIVIKGNVVIDVAIFLASIYALGALGPTISGGLMFAGIGYTGIVAPRYRERHKNRII
jgi:hypothetical protein